MGKRETEKEKEFRQLFEENYVNLYYASLTIVGDEDEARNIVDDLFASLWEKYDPCLHTFNSSYLMTSVRHRSLDYMKKARVREQYARSFLVSNEEAVLMDDFDEERMRTLERVMDKMSKQTRFVLDQCYMEGKKYAEVADMMGISREGVKKHIVKALKMMREAFNVKR
ncbi:MAG: sigma-70 family RNA polymerase sigma factor [Prevotella sp.]